MLTQKKIGRKSARRVYFTRQDLEHTVDFFAHGMSAVVRPKQRVLILMAGKRPNSVGDLLAKALGGIDAESIIYGAVEDPSNAVHAILEHEIDCLVGIPGQVLSIAKHRGMEEVPPGQIKAVLLSPEACLDSAYIPETTVDELRKIWNCSVFRHYGIAEMGFGGCVECGALSGSHLREADLYFEIVDPHSGKPQVPGRSGEIVFSTLTRKGMPLIRYRTGHIGVFLTEPCSCGSSLRRISEVRDMRNREYFSSADLSLFECESDRGAGRNV